MANLMQVIGRAVMPGEAKALSSVPDHRGWFGLVRESFGGAWQRNVTVDRQEIEAFHAIFACKTLIASDVAKLRIKLVKFDASVWTETSSPAYSPVLRKPNHFQTRIQFWENWILSKLSRGNTYVLKQRDARGVVTRLYVLDPNRVRPMVSDDGAVWYELSSDHLAGVTTATMLVPASEIIHDRFNCLFHPLVGISPIFACGLAATQGLRIQNNSANFFGNASKPGGLLIAPSRIDPDNAQRLKEYWDTNFTGENAGKIAVLGDGLKYEGLTVDPVDAQLVDQLKWTAEVVCSTFHVPPYKIGVGQMPTYNNIQSLNVEYYSQCLQSLIEAAELCLDEGLGIGEAAGIGTEFDVDNLLRMDAATQMDVLDKARNTMTPNEARRKLELPPAKGGDAVYRQQQDYSLEALAKRDAREDPFATGARTAPAPPAGGDPPSEAERGQRRAVEKAALAFRARELMHAA